MFAAASTENHLVKINPVLSRLKNPYHEKLGVPTYFPGLLFKCLFQ